METFLYESGYLGLFIVTFVSATLIPVSAEVFLMAMTALGYSFIGMLTIATLGNFLGAIFNYSIGRQGMAVLENSRFCPKPETVDRLQSMFGRWGSVVLFFSWLPIIGDPMTLIAGVIGIPLRSFMLWVLTGRFIRYVVFLVLGERILQFFL